VTQQGYRSSITANISPIEAFDKISRVSDWWTTGVEGKSQSIGDEFTVRFGNTFVKFRVIELVPGKSAAWEVIDCNLHWISNKTEWRGTTLVWNLSSADGQTRVTMTHLGLLPGIECYNDCSTGWNFYVGQSLLQLLTGGKGLPDQRSKTS
jgi:hypothetical protein